MLSTFSCVCWPSVCLLWGNACLGLQYIFDCFLFVWLLFVFLILSCISCLYIFEINSLTIASFAIIFPHSEDCLFTLLIVSFIMQKILRLIRSHLFIFPFFPLLWEVGLTGSCCDLCQSVLPMFSSSSFTVSGLTLRSLIHFAFILVYGVRKCSSFILLQVVDHFN